MRIREIQGSAEAYQIRLGGTQRRFGVVLGEYKTEDCPRVIETVLDTFLAVRQSDETLADAVWRGAPADAMEPPGIGPFREAVRKLDLQYQCAPKPAEFSVFTGEGSSALDLKTMARDIPCQAACPDSVLYT